MPDTNEMKPIRVLQMIGSLNIGGSQAMIINLYKAIDRTKIQFDFILDHPEACSLVPVVEALGARIYTMPSFNGKNVKEIQKAWSSFFKKHTEYKILHSHVRSYASIYIPIAKKYGLKTIIHSHSTSNGSGISSLVKMILQYPLRFQADYFFGCSHEAGEWLFGRKIVKSDRYFMLQNAIDTNLYVQNTSIRESYRKEIGVQDKKVFLHVGRLHPSKNHSFLLSIFSEYVKKEDNSILLVVGDGELRTEIENQIKELNLQKFVRLLGARNDVPNLMQAADCFLFPSKWEGLPVTVVEAQAAGLPCLVSDTVTKDVNVSSLVKNISIIHGVQPWINAIAETSFSKTNVMDKIIAAGFDISSSARWLSEFYLELNKNE